MGAGKKGMERKYKCEKCKKSFAMDWAKEAHEKNCFARVYKVLKK